MNAFAKIDEIPSMILQDIKETKLGGSPSRKILRFNTVVFRKDKWGIILKVIIRTSGCCGVLKWCLLVEIRGDNSVPIFQICSHMKFALNY